MTNEATNEAPAPDEAVEGKTTPEKAADAPPPHTDSPVMHLALTNTSTTVLRRAFADGKPSILLFVLSTSSMTGKQLPMLTFSELLEFNSAFEHIINSVVASSSNMLSAPPKAEAVAEAKAEPATPAS